MRRSVPSILARQAQGLLDTSGSCSCSKVNPAAALRQFAAAAQRPSGTSPAAGSPTAAAHAAMKAPHQAPPEPRGSTGVVLPRDHPEASSSGGGGGGWFFPALTIAAAGGGYYAYTQKQAGEGGKLPTRLPNLSLDQLDPAQKRALEMFNKGKEKVQSLLPSILGGSKEQPKPSKTHPSSSSSSEQHHRQRHVDQEESGFRILPPEAEAAAATAAAADAATAASAAARDSLSAAADEFPGSTPIASGQQGPVVLMEDLGGLMGIEHMDMTPIADLFADVTGAQPDTVSSSSSKVTTPVTDAAAAHLAAGVSKMQAAAAADAGASAAAAPAAAAAAAMAAAAAPAGERVESVEMREVEDSQLEKLCAKLGLSKDLAPSGLVAAANRAGLGPVNSSGAHVAPQMAQLNQATADARILGEVLELAAQSTARLAQELEEARKQSTWAEEAAYKREASLTEHFKELMREQSRIHQQLTEAAVKEAQQLVLADTAKAHLQERQERLQLIDALRDKVNALAVAFQQRTAQLRSAQDVNKVSLGMLSLSKALEEGAPIGPQLQQLAAACPEDPLVEAVAASLPASAASQGLPTMQELRESFGDVAQAAAEAAYFSGQETQGGVLAHLAAKLAAKLKVDAGTDVPNSIDAKLSQARAALQQGQLSAAAEALTSAAQGTQAAAVVQQWVADARARAAADQAVKLLQAHATATAGLTS